MSADLVLDVESAMTSSQRRAAYARFVGKNPSFAGAYWADILDELVGRELPMAADILVAMNEDQLDPDTAPWYTAAVLSLMYADGALPSHDAALALALAAKGET